MYVYTPPPTPPTPPPPLICLFVIRFHWSLSC